MRINAVGCGLAVVLALISGCKTRTASPSSPPPFLRLVIKDGSLTDGHLPGLRTYDQELVEAVVQRWYDLLDARNWDGGEYGKVVVVFHLHRDGRVSDAKVVETTMDEGYSLICLKAITDPAPYKSWPEDMRDLIKIEVRNLTFTFYSTPTSEKSERAK